jgi:formylglycine-generating enzyme required for sulfatase activity
MEREIDGEGAHAMSHSPTQFITVVLVAVLGAGVTQAGVFDPDVYGTGASMADYLRAVPGGGQPGGPAYDFFMGRYEITNAQFAAFLNDAQLDGGATGKGSNMYFQDDGRVRTAPGGPTLFRAQPASFSQIAYDVGAPLGQRFTVATKDGMDMSAHPAVLMTWYGAVKFANWLTLDQGLPAGERAYTEGPTGADWHPVTIGTADWQTRDLNAAERQALVDDYEGFRLPMDDQASTASAYNEWYKAAAWDPDDQVNHVYGFGRDTIDYMDANGHELRPWEEFLPDDPFEAGSDPDTTPVGFYDGTLWQRSDWNWPDQDPFFATFQTRANGNAYGILDLSGNLEELVQDQWGPPGYHGLRGAGWGGVLDLAYVNAIYAGADSYTAGFRIVHVPEPTTVIPFLLGVALVIWRHRR